MLAPALPMTEPAMELLTSSFVTTCWLPLSALDWPEAAPPARAQRSLDPDLRASPLPSSCYLPSAVALRVYLAISGTTITSSCAQARVGAEELVSRSRTC